MSAIFRTSILALAFLFGGGVGSVFLEAPTDFAGGADEIAAATLSHHAIAFCAEAACDGEEEEERSLDEATAGIASGAGTASKASPSGVFFARDVALPALSLRGLAANASRAPPVGA